MNDTSGGAARQSVFFQEIHLEFVHVPGSRDVKVSSNDPSVNVSELAQMLEKCADR